jgi:hypothetical protein
MLRACLSPLLALLGLLRLSAAFLPNAGFRPCHPHVGLIVASSVVLSRSRPRELLQLHLQFMTHYEEIQLDTDHGMSIFDITSQIEAIIAKSECKEGTVTVLSKHSTVSVSINEMEGRLVDE